MLAAEKLTTKQKDIDIGVFEAKSRLPGVISNNLKYATANLPEIVAMVS